MFSFLWNHRTKVIFFRPKELRTCWETRLCNTYFDRSNHYCLEPDSQVPMWDPFLVYLALLNSYAILLKAFTVTNNIKSQFAGMWFLYYFVQSFIKFLIRYLKLLDILRDVISKTADWPNHGINFFCTLSYISIGQGICYLFFFTLFYHCANHWVVRMVY